MEQQNLVYITEDFQVFIGSIKDNINHQHYALQVSIPLDSKITINTTTKSFSTASGFIIGPNVPHKLAAKKPHLLLLFNPTSSVGHYWNSLRNKNIEEIDSMEVREIKRITSLILSHKINEQQGIQQLIQFIQSLDCGCSSFVHSGDSRMENAILYLNDNQDRIVPVSEIANYLSLSESRFLHLFRENTGITYRRAQLWNKLIGALYLIKNVSITEAAIEVGFSDSAHFSRTFKENFGFSPRDVLKHSQFIQV